MLPSMAQPGVHRKAQTASRRSSVTIAYYDYDRMNKARRGEICERWRANNPNPNTELNYKNHFELLISIILSAQATDVAVNKATPALFRLAPNPRTMAALELERISACIQTIGLYRNKAKHLKKCAHILAERYHSRIPETRSELEALPGVGAKTAGVFLNVALDKPEIPVDTHVFRVANRTGLTKAANEKETERQLKRRLPTWAKHKAHHWMILHGRYVCLARKPRCSDCCIEDLCEYREKIFASS